MTKLKIALICIFTLLSSASFAQDTTTPSETPVQPFNKVEPDSSVKNAPSKSIKDAPSQKVSKSQQALEVVQTQFLNRFAASGFAEILSMEKVDNKYSARVRTVRRNVARIDIDPVTGRILAISADTPNGQSSETYIDSNSPWPTTGWDSKAPMSQAQTPTTPSQPSMSSMEPRTGCVSNWRGLNDTINNLDPSYEVQARRMMLQVWDMHASNQIEECQAARMQLDQFVQSARG